MLLIYLSLGMIVSLFVWPKMGRPVEHPIYFILVLLLYPPLLLVVFASSLLDLAKILAKGLKA